MSNISKTELLELSKAKKDTYYYLNKINNGYPIQYVIGYVDFYGYKINVNKNVLIPRYETETLVEKTINYLKKYKFNNIKALDLCTGSGCIAIAISKELDIPVDASDISSKALKVAKKNAKENKCNINFIKSDMLKNVNKKYDLIISNPPYIPNDEQLDKTVLTEPFIALFGGTTGLDYIEELINNVDNHLNDKGIMAIEIHETHKDKLEELLTHKKLNFSIEKDLCDKYRYLFIFKNCE